MIYLKAKTFSKCHLNSVKNAITVFSSKSQKSPRGWELCPQSPSVIRLIYIGLVVTEPTLRLFWCKKIYLLFKPPHAKKILVSASGRIHSCRQIFLAIIRAAYKQVNKRCRAYTSLLPNMTKFFKNGA